jgi:hypothetical protein
MARTAKISAIDSKTFALVLAEPFGLVLETDSLLIARQFSTLGQ